MIPANVRKAHIIKAIREMDSKGVPARRESKKFLLIFEGKTYPPKYAVALANKFANGHFLESNEFNGGKETNNFLKQLGFKVEKIPASNGPSKEFSSRQPVTRHNVQKHTERCPKCKETVEILLRKLYGEVRNFKRKVSTNIEDYKSFPYYSNLRMIFESLQKYRGYGDFVRTPFLPPSDFFIPEPGFVVEFDESQHFTFPRKLSLQRYPKSLNLGFPQGKWIDLCERINAKDNDSNTPFRDEQRGWYDTLRDFLPEIADLKPTVRIYAGDRKWCSLDPDNAEDLVIFRRVIEGAQMKLNGWVATVCLESNEKYSNSERLQVLSKVVDSVAGRTQGDGVILFPGGWFKAGNREARTLYEWVESNVSEILKKQGGRNIVACIGIDGRETPEWAKDQIGAAVSRNGIIALGRKFHPAPNEEDYVELANDQHSDEDGKPRMFTVAGRNFFICACYDSFGIKHKRLPNPGLDVVLDLVHGFYPKGEGNSGAANFSRHGLAGASNQWECPVFAGTVFFRTEIPQNWPSGVYWDKGETYSSSCTYKNITIKPTLEISLQIKEGRSLIRVFDL